jgi:hypothetical protein
MKAKALNITLWILQSLLSLTLLWAAWMKLTTPVEKLSLMWPWVAQVPVALLKGTAIVDLAGAIGLVLPVKSITPLAAIGVVLLMICASIFHISRGEASLIGFNIVFAIPAGLVAWGRFTTKA